MGWIFRGVGMDMDMLRLACSLKDRAARKVQELGVDRVLVGYKGTMWEVALAKSLDEYPGLMTIAGTDSLDPTRHYYA